MAPTTIVLLAASLLSTVAAQTAVPSNTSFPQSITDNGTILEMRFTNPNTGMTDFRNLLPAWALDSNELQNVTQLEMVKLSGNLVTTNTSNYNGLTRGDLAFISCDPEIYEQGNIDMQTVINGATDKVRAPGNDTLSGGKGGGIILYSLVSQWCNFTDSDAYTYQNVFTLVDEGDSNYIYQVALASGNGPMVGIAPSRGILPNTGSDGNNSSSNNDDDDSTPGFDQPPTTTIAMIILYIITGIITLMFMVIIASGAIRAHRHPERYRRQMLLGRPVEGSRARGIAAGILDTLPIIKFGERDSAKDTNVAAGTGTHNTDIEMQDTTTPPTAVVPVPAENERQSDASANLGTDTHPSGVTTVDAISASSVGPETAAEAGLACSVCTEDFVKGQDARVLPCNHKFHPECIDPWLLNVSGTCPLCRIDLRGPDADRSDSHASAASQDHGIDTNRDHILSGSQEDTANHERRSAVVSTVIHRALNRAHMSRATPEQRLEALRDLRNTNRNTDEVLTPEVSEAPRERLRDRARRALRRDRSEPAAPT